MGIHTSEIPALSIFCFAIAWAVIAIFLTIKGGWLSMPGRNEAFPFSARQFFLMLLSLVVVFAFYIASFLVSRALIIAVQRVPVIQSVWHVSNAEWGGA